MMLNKVVAILLLSLLILFPQTTLAHPGKTAADGCHYCKTNCNSYGVAFNERHCHTTTNTTPSNTIQRGISQPIATSKPVIQKQTPATNNQAIPITAKVTKVIDGDTIEVSINGKKDTVRLLTIDSPETKDKRKPVQCYGNEAFKKLRSLIQGKTVRLDRDGQQGDRDSYKRLLRYVYLTDGTDINAQMVKQGYAFVYTNIPSDKLDQFRILETQAREEKRGLWGKCKTS